MAVQVKGTRQVLDHHLQSLGAGGIDAILEDYDEQSVLLTPDATLKGLVAIRAAFEAFLTGLFKPGTYELTMDSVRVEADVAFIAWHAKCASADVVLGTDTFIVRDGRIATQTFTAKIEPR